MGRFKSISGNIPGGNFLGGNFPGGDFPGGRLMGGNFPGGVFLIPSSSSPNDKAFSSFLESMYEE